MRVPLIRRLIAGKVTDIFNDRARGEKPVTRRPDGLFGPTAVAWTVHGDVTTMMIGGVSSLLLQMLHPAVLAGVWDHSNFRADMHGRLRRTARFIATTTYGSGEEAMAAISRVRRIHSAVKGTLPDGTLYQADDPQLLAWVHVTEAVSFLDAWIRYGEPGMPRVRQDRYFAEVAQIGRALGADPVPETREATERAIQDMRRQLKFDQRTRTVAELVLSQRIEEPLLRPALGVLLRAGVDLLPDWAQAMHGAVPGRFKTRANRLAAENIARTLRWAFSSR